MVKGQIFYNRISGIKQVKGQKYKNHTIHIIKEKLKEFQDKLEIGDGIKPTEQTKGDLWKGIEKLNLCSFENQEVPEELNPKYIFNFGDDSDRLDFNKRLEMRITEKTKSEWWPKKKTHSDNGKMWITDEIIQPKYPIYILSYGRSEKRLTCDSLDSMNVDYRIVIEKKEYDLYNKYIPSEKILVLPDEYQKLKDEGIDGFGGGIPARNFIWEHSISEGHEAHWILDDNIDKFYRWNHNKRLPVKSGICFKMCEDYFDMTENVAQVGIQYFSFFPEISMKRPVYIPNTRIYSCMLNKNNLTERWRGKYNEDTDLSLRLLKKGYSTILFQNFLCNKQTTKSCKGGNTDSIYKDDGLQKKLDSLINQHPDCVKGTIKFSKVHHQVDYKSFKKNEIKIKKECKKLDFSDYPQMTKVVNPNYKGEVVEEEEDEEDNCD